MIGRMLMTGLGLGYAPVASGTFGSAGAVGIAWIIWTAFWFSGLPLGYTHLVLSVLLLATIWACIHWGPWAVAHFGSRSRKPTDPGFVVLDEFAGQWLSIVGIAMPDPKRAALVLVVQFFLFRVFDVIKPPPARMLEKLPFGWGILFDDLAAAVYANLIGQLIFRFLIPYEWAPA